MAGKDFIMTQLFKRILANAIVVSGMIFLISVLTLAAVFTAQYAFGLEPCTLCIYQRWPYAITALLGIIGLGSLYEESWYRYASIIIFLSSITFFVGGLIAFYHVGVEQHWWRSVLEGCAADFKAGSVQEIVAILDKKPAVRCDQVAWSFMGISMAGYNMIASLIWAFLSGYSAVLVARKANGVL